MQGRKNKVIGFMVCGPDEKYLENTLKEFDRLCDETIICLNNGNQETLIRRYGFTVVKDNREWGKDQWKIKQNLLNQYVMPRNPDWVIALDADETFDSSFTRDELEVLANKGGAGYYFYIINLYNEGYSKEWSFWNVRMFNPKHGTKFAQKSLHPGLAPEQAYFWGNYAPFILKHYGLKDKVDRDKKVLRYKKYDPDAKFKGRAYYDFLDSKAPVTDFDETELHNIVANEVKDYKHKIPTENMDKQKKYYYVKNPGGIIVDIPEEALQETLKRDGFELISNDPVVVGGTVKTEKVETPEEPQKEENEMTCTECGFVAKSEFGLRAHSRKHVRADNSKVQQ